MYDVSQNVETAVALYAKGHYGNFTGDSLTVYDDLKKILSPICLIDPKYVSNKDIFNIVLEIFMNIMPNANGHGVLFMEAFHRTFFQDFIFSNPDKDWDNKEIRFVNQMLLKIAMTPVKFFQDPSLAIDPEIAKLFA